MNATTLFPWLVLAGFAGLHATAQAQVFDYDERRSAELRRCDDASERGRTAQARSCYEALRGATAAPLLRAEASWALGDPRGANEQFRAAAKADARAVLPRVRWGRLFLAAHQYGDATKLLQEALAIDPNDVGARLALARLAAQRFDGPADAAIAELLTQDGTLIEAHLVAGRMALEAGRYDAALESARSALALSQRQKRAPLEAWSLLAAVEIVNNRNPQRWTRAALEVNPRYGGIFEELAHFEIIRRRYREGAVWLRRAVEVQPDLWTAHRELGVNLLRLGDRAGARVHLERAYGGDPFSVTTVNTLRLLDSLGQYEFVQLAAPPRVLQLHRQEAAALRPYVEQLTGDSMATFGRRYGFVPHEPVTVELYPNHDDFAVRTAGLPGIGLLGVAFGHVVAMDSPSGRRTGEFHWGSTLWHEMAHVFSLSATGHRVPRWLSEGISVFEEWRTGPASGVSLTPPALDAFRAGRFMPVMRLDEGFIRPDYPNQVQVSYTQAGLTCLFIEQRWGFEKLAAFLRAFASDRSTAAAIRATFDIPAEEFDDLFRGFMARRFAAYLADPDEWLRLARRADEMLEEKQWEAARSAAREAIRIFPEFTGAGTPYRVLADVEEATGNAGAAIDALLAWRRAGGWDPAALRRLAELFEEAGRDTEAMDVLEALNYADPLTPAGHAQLGEQLLRARRAADAQREFRVLLALQPDDAAMAQFGLARAYRLAGDTAQARRHLLESLETAPHHRPAQRLLLELTGERTP